MSNVSTIDDFKARAMRRLELPSGLSLLARRVSPFDYVALAGHLPSAILAKVAAGDRQSLTPDAIVRDGELLIEILRRSIVEPAGLDPLLLAAADLAVLRAFVLEEAEADSLAGFPERTGPAAAGASGEVVGLPPERILGT
jgi:hypothetical protein